MNARPVHRPSRLLSALALVVLVLAGRFAESFHAAQASHAVCPEHGELVHISAAHAHDGDHAGEVPLGAGIRPIESSVEHDHCLLATLLWSSGETWVPAETFTPASSLACESSAPSAESARFSLPPLSFAPKHSPPARVV